MLSKSSWMLLTLALVGYVDARAEDQLIEYRDATKCPIGFMTTTAGNPVEFNSTNTVNTELLRNELFMEVITQVTREKIPERVVHAKGAGAFGYFEVTHDVTDICKAKFLNEVGKTTPIVVRFSSAFENLGGIDTSREIRGFSIKFYTEEGNFDYLGLSVEMFSIKDPVYFPTFNRVFKRNPVNNLRDDNMRWDGITALPMSLNLFMLVFGDRGIPANYSSTPGFAIHTYQLENEKGDTTFVRMHILPDEGIKTMTSEEAEKITGEDPDYMTRNLYNRISDKDYPTYTFSVQAVTPEEAFNATFDLFDVTLKWPVDKYPLRPVGKIVLNQNPRNYFADVEQLALCPCNLVPGILGGVDKIFESRLLSYRDTQYHRLGKNHNKIDVNYPFRVVPRTYNRDGVPYTGDNEGGAPNYFPNTFNGPVPYPDTTKNAKYVPFTSPEVTNFEQANDQYLYEKDDAERERLHENIVSSLKNAAKHLQDKAVELYSKINKDLGRILSEKLQEESKKAKESSK